jgi:hypothetical protein
MKQLKKPTRQQKILLQKRKMNPRDWMVERDTPEKLVLVHRHFNGTRREIYKEVNDEY